MATNDNSPNVRRVISEGVTYYFCKPFDSEFVEPLLMDIFEEVIQSIATIDQMEIPPLDQFGLLRGSSPPMRKLYRMLRKVAPTDASIMCKWFRNLPFSITTNFSNLVRSLKPSFLSSFLKNCLFTRSNNILVLKSLLSLSPPE